MHNPYEIPICPTTIMCKSCKGIGTLGGSLYLTESCLVCKGSGMVQKGREEDE